jgi:cytochrome P450
MTPLADPHPAAENRQPGLHAAARASLAPCIQQLTDELLDALFARPDDRADLVREPAFPLPIAVICELLGVPLSDSEVIRPAR